MRPIPELAAAFVKQHEGLVLSVYDDARPKLILRPGDEPVGTLTAGYGHTGAELHPGLTVTQERAEAWLRDDLAIAGRRLSARIGIVAEELTEQQYAALLSFVFNLGAEPGWTIWKVLKRRQFDQVPLEMMKFVNARGKKLRGLVKRRAAEVELWSTDEPGSEDVQLTSGALRLMNTPPTPGDATPAHKSINVWTAITTAVTGFFAAVLQWLGQVPDWARQAISMIDPFADKSPIVQNMVMGISTVGSVAALLLMVRTIKDKTEARR